MITCRLVSHSISNTTCPIGYLRISSPCFHYPSSADGRSYTAAVRTRREDIGAFDTRTNWNLFQLQPRPRHSHRDWDRIASYMTAHFDLIRRAAKIPKSLHSTNFRLSQSKICLQFSQTTRKQCYRVRWTRILAISIEITKRWYFR